MLYVTGTTSYVDLAARTGFSDVHCRRIVRRKLAEKGSAATVELLRASLWADLEMMRVAYEPLIHITKFPDGTPLSPGMYLRPNNDDATIYLKILAQQAALLPKWVDLGSTNNAPPENEEARASARRVVEFMTLSEKLAAIGPPRQRISTETAEEIIEGEIAAPAKPELLREYCSTKNRVPGFDRCCVPSYEAPSQVTLVFCLPRRGFAPSSRSVVTYGPNGRSGFGNGENGALSGKRWTGPIGPTVRGSRASRYRVTSGAAWLCVPDQNLRCGSWRSAAKGRGSADTGPYLKSATRVRV